MRDVAAGQPANLAPYQSLLAVLAQIRDAHTALPALIHQNEHYQNGSHTPALAVLESAPGETHAGLNGHDSTAVQPLASGAEEQTTVRLATTMLDQILNETGELLTCAVTSRQRARAMRILADLPAGWRRTWRQVRPVISRLQDARHPFSRSSIIWLTRRIHQRRCRRWSRRTA
jgi:hypothetical protein